MASSAFVTSDFKIFDVNGFKPRMSEIRARVRPKLDAFGGSLAPSVSHSVGGEVFAHVARHARRTVNPPDDTWVAFGPDARGYKKHGHFKIAVSRSDAGKARRAGRRADPDPRRPVRRRARRAGRRSRALDGGAVPLRGPRDVPRPGASLPSPVAVPRSRRSSSAGSTRATITTSTPTDTGGENRRERRPLPFRARALPAPRSPARRQVTPVGIGGSGARSPRCSTR